MSTIFTKIINRELPAHIVSEDDHYIAFLDINPLRLGHTLVVPKLEIDYIFDLPEPQYQGIFKFAKKIAEAIEKAFICERVGLSVIGLEVPHVHIHLVPIDQVDDLNFSRPKLNPDPEELKVSTLKIQKHLSQS